jgi:hypothetical protein
MARSTADIVMLAVLGSVPAEVEPDVLAAVVRIHFVIEIVLVQFVESLFTLVTKLQLVLAKVVRLVKEAAVVIRVVHLRLEGSSAN